MRSVPKVQHLGAANLDHLHAVEELLRLSDGRKHAAPHKSPPNNLDLVKTASPLLTILSSGFSTRQNPEELALMRCETVTAPSLISSASSRQDERWQGT